MEDRTDIHEPGDEELLEAALHAAVGERDRYLSLRYFNSTIFFFSENDGAVSW